MSDSEESSVVDSSSASESQTSGRDQQSRISEESIARSETRRVTRSKYLVAFVIFVAAAAVGTATFFFTQTEENDDFESEVS